MTILLLLLFLSRVDGFFVSSPSRSPFPQTSHLLSLTSSANRFRVDDEFNVKLEDAANLWTVTVSANDSVDRVAGTPYLDSKNTDYFVDDVELTLNRVGGFGLELIELAGGRDDGLGITIIENVLEGSNAEAAGIIPGDSLSFISQPVKDKIGDSETPDNANAKILECRDFDTTMEALTSLPSPDELPKVVVGVKRIKRWPKITTRVTYPSCQVAEGADPTVELELFAGENLKRALQTRGIVFEDGNQRKCDFCGQKCMVKVQKGGKLLSPMSTTEEKLMERNVRCRVSCKTVVGHLMQEGELDLSVNVMLK
mmetsp:Transcript_2107/g.4272  ORF Transcript_2107/g.4272 Transcript_2107/m.4272 type:complete len:312 (-) Transcript_2107:47-982(-)